MSLYCLLLRSIRHRHTSSITHYFHTLTHHPITTSTHLSSTTRSYPFSSAEKAAAERRRTLVDPSLSLHNGVQSLIHAGDLDATSYVARQAVFSNICCTVFTYNAIIAAMYRAKRYNKAIALFAHFFKQFDIVPNVVSYNNLINAHYDEGRVDDTMGWYRKIIEPAPFSPSHITYRHLTKVFIDSGRIHEALELLREMLNKGQGADLLVYNNLISRFLSLGNLEKTNELFDELKERCVVYDGVVNATFMESWFKQGKEKEVMESYKSLDRNLG